MSLGRYRFDMDLDSPTKYFDICNAFDSNLS